MHLIVNILLFKHQKEGMFTGQNCYVIRLIAAS